MLSYAVLIQVSPGYPPDKGRLHTCYAPVRRWHCCPLALHVLCLPLAFILSQDQTLHCKLFVGLLLPIFAYLALSRQWTLSLPHGSDSYQLPTTFFDNQLFTFSLPVLWECKGKWSFLISKNIYEKYFLSLSTPSFFFARSLNLGLQRYHSFLTLQVLVMKSFLNLSPFCLLSIDYERYRYNSSWFYTIIFLKLDGGWSKLCSYDDSDGGNSVFFIGRNLKNTLNSLEAMILQGRSAGSTTERSFRWNFLDLLDFFLLPKGRSDGTFWIC